MGARTRLASYHGSAATCPVHSGAEIAPVLIVLTVVWEGFRDLQSLHMPLYRFAVHTSHPSNESEAIEPLPDDGAALEEAKRIIGALKNNAAAMRIGWTIEVTDGERTVCEITFLGKTDQ